tara:strand:- start:11759 stop:12016 length:258 start_codon:yes stop_codon:yes gene_type:complete
VNAHLHSGKQADGLRHIHRVAAEPVHLRDNQHVPLLQPIDQAGEHRPLLRGHTARDRLGNDPPFRDAEAGRLQLLHLVLDSLLDG